MSDGGVLSPRIVMRWPILPHYQRPSISEGSGNSVGEKRSRPIFEKTNASRAQKHVRFCLPGGAVALPVASPSNSGKRNKKARFPVSILVKENAAGLDSSENDNTSQQVADIFAGTPASGQLGLVRGTDCSAAERQETARDILETKSANAIRQDGDELRASLTCPICLDLFYKPCTLSCGHSFCRSCIVHYECEVASKKRTPVAGPCPCPACRAPTVSSQQLSENVILKVLIERNFPHHVEVSERVDLLKGKRTYLQFLGMRSKLQRFKDERDELTSEMDRLARELTAKKERFRVVSKECGAQLVQARLLKGMLDAKAHTLSKNDRRSLAALAEPEKQLPAIEEILKQVEERDAAL